MQHVQQCIVPSVQCQRYEHVHIFARRIHRVLEVCSVDKLTVNPDCGFGWSPRYMCNQKVRALAAGAKLARTQLTGRAI